MFDTILFDLDGTLTNPYMGITNAIMYALKQLGREIPPREELKSFIGPPLYDEFRRKFGMDDAEAREAVRQYRVYYPDKGLYENELIDGAEELLSQLKRQGKRICLATSKPKPFAQEILRYFGIAEYFDYVGGAALDGTLGTKTEVLFSVLQATGAAAENCVLVGDRMHDIIGAHEAGMKCIAVLVGFGSREELAEYGADYIAQTLGDVLALV
ncbi:MAG: HAD family hydrolase [Oscillospiraceae bacterium]